MNLSQRLEQINPSATLALKTKANQLKQQGKNVIDLSAGEPDFPTPTHIRQAAISAINNNQTHYTAVDGIAELKTAIIKKFKTENNLDYNASQIIVSAGAKHSLYNIFQAILNSGDEVIIPVPYWVSYPEMVRLANGTPVFINAHGAADMGISDAITANTRAIILNSPNNPSGVVYSRAELRQLADTLLQHPDIMIISDDIYEHICWHPNGFNNILNIEPKLADRTIIVNGVSKAYAMTGWRIGYAAGPAGIIKGMKKIQAHSTSCPTSISQYAALAALSDSQDCVKQMVAEFKQRHDLLYTELSKIDGIEIQPATGAFYLFPNIDGLMRKLGINSDIEFCEQLLTKTGLVLVPGSAFGAPGFIRISYAADMTVLLKAVKILRSLN